MRYRTGTAYALASALVLACSDSGGSPTDEGEPPEEVDPSVWGVSGGQPAFGISGRAVGWDFELERTTARNLGTDPVVFAGLVDDTIVVAGIDGVALRFAGGIAGSRAVQLPDATDREVRWFAGAGDGRLWVDVGGMLYDVDHRAGTVLDSLAIPAVAGARVLGDDLVLASQGPDAALVLMIVRGGDLDDIVVLDVPIECIDPLDLFERPAGRIHVLCGGTGNLPGRMVAVSAADGSMVGTDEHVQLGADIHAFQSQLAWIPGVDRAGVVTRTQEILLYDPETASFTGSFDAGSEDRNIASIVYVPDVDRVVVSRYPEPYDVEGPFDFGILEPSGAEVGTFSNVSSTPVWLIVR